MDGPAFVLLAGGAARQASVWAGLRHLRVVPPQYVFVHDAARPFLDRQILDDVSQALRSGDAWARRNAHGAELTPLSTPPVCW